MVSVALIVADTGRSRAGSELGNWSRLRPQTQSPLTDKCGARFEDGGIRVCDSDWNDEGLES